MHAAARLQEGDGLYTKHSTQPEEYEENPPLSDKQRKDRKATFLGSLSMGIGAGQARDEAEELPYSTKALEQQHWLEMIDAKVSTSFTNGSLSVKGVELTSFHTAPLWSVKPQTISGCSHAEAECRQQPQILLPRVEGIGHFGQLLPVVSDGAMSE